MKNVTRRGNRGESYYMGDFVPPLSLEAFLSRPKTQYAVFVADMKDLKRRIERSPKLLGKLGTEVEVNAKGEAVTMSGLLALANAAGLKGAYQWLTTDADRQRFPNTTKAFLTSNGIF